MSGSPILFGNLKSSIKRINVSFKQYICKRFSLYTEKISEFVSWLNFIKAHKIHLFYEKRATTHYARIVINIYTPESGLQSKTPCHFSQRLRNTSTESCCTLTCMISYFCCFFNQIIDDRGIFDAFSVDRVWLTFRFLVMVDGNFQLFSFDIK